MTTWRIRAAVAALALALHIGSASVAMAAGGGGAALRIEPPRSITSRVLLDQDGRSATFPAHGRWQLVFFGYTHCPDVCPVTLHKSAELLKELGPNAHRVQPVFISIDTDRDHPAQIKQFVDAHDPRIAGFTGRAAEVQRLANEFDIIMRRYQGKTAFAYTIEHSAFMYLVDPQGRVRTLYPATANAADIAADLRDLGAVPAAR